MLRRARGLSGITERRGAGTLLAEAAGARLAALRRCGPSPCRAGERPHAVTQVPPVTQLPVSLVSCVQSVHRHSVYQQGSLQTEGVANSREDQNTCFLNSQSEKSFHEKLKRSYRGDADEKMARKSLLFLDSVSANQRSGLKKPLGQSPFNMSVEGG